MIQWTDTEPILSPAYFREPDIWWVWVSVIMTPAAANQSPALLPADQSEASSPSIIGYK